MPDPANTLNGTPLVSVVVPTYQHAAYIEQCIQGILMQETSFPVEILIGEDESSDGTREICQRIAAAHPDRIRLFLRSRKDVMHIMGQPSGRANLLHLLNESKGKYIALCEGDDYWTAPLKLQKQVDALELDPAAAGCFNLVQVRMESSGTLGRVYGQHDGKLTFTLEDTISTTAILHTSGFLFRMRALPTEREWLKKFLVSMDMALFSLVAGTGDLICLPEVMGVYRKHDGGITETAAFKNALFHFHRINLWLNVDQHLHYRVHAKCVEVMRFHWRNIFIVCTPRTRLRHLFKLVLIHPGWFLLHPVFALARLRDCLRR